MKNYILILYFVFFSVTIFAQDSGVSVGADRIFSDKSELIEGKSIGLITNHTGRLSDGTHLIEKFLAYDSANLKVLFGPEHGIVGNAPDGKSISDSSLASTGIPIYSLYGDVRKPTPEMLEGVDLLIFDIQDIGSRYYTYISTMYHCMEAAAENDIPMLILDRPNPIGGIQVEGPLRTEKFKSFVAIAPVPIVHGMTVGELATLFNEEGFITSDKKADLTVAKMKNWKREYLYDDCGIPWVKPSPNMPTLETALLYPGLCLLEGVNISEGRGTYKPFIQIGAPFIDSDELINELKKSPVSGIEFSPAEFTPVSIDTMSKYPKYLDEKCYGVEFKIVDENFNSLRFGIYLLSSLKDLYPDNFEFRRNWIDKLYGSTALKEELKGSNNPETVFNSWQNDLTNFINIRNKYLLY